MFIPMRFVDVWPLSLKHSYTLCVNSLDIIGCWQLDRALLVTRRSFHLPFNSRQVSWSKWMPWKGSTKIHCSFIILCPFVWKRRIQSSSVLCTLYWQTVPISGFNIQHVQMHKSIRIHKFFKHKAFLFNHFQSSTPFSAPWCLQLRTLVPGHGSPTKPIFHRWSLAFRPGTPGDAAARRSAGPPRMASYIAAPCHRWPAAPSARCSLRWGRDNCSIGAGPELTHCIWLLNLCIWLLAHRWLIEGSLEVKLPTIWTVEKQRWEESEEKRSEERRCRCAKR